MISAPYKINIYYGIKPSLAANNCQVAVVIGLGIGIYVLQVTGHPKSHIKHQVFTLFSLFGLKLEMWCNSDMSF